MGVEGVLGPAWGGRSCGATAPELHSVQLEVSVGASGALGWGGGGHTGVVLYLMNISDSEKK